MKKPSNTIPLVTINKQRAMPLKYNSENTLLINSIFNTIQGEGPFAGSPATFIRLTGCNLRCPACDTEYTSVMEIGDLSDHYNILTHLHNMDALPLIVVTGGEPFRQNLNPLINTLINHGYRVQIETNGTLPPPPGYLDQATIVCSPKTHFVHPDLLPHINSFKYVLDRNDMSDDGLPIRALGHKVKGRVYRKPKDHHAEVFLQPIDVQDDIENKLHQDAVVQSCIANGYRLCLQIHKFIGVE